MNDGVRPYRGIGKLMCSIRTPTVEIPNFPPPPVEVLTMLVAAVGFGASGGGTVHKRSFIESAGAGTFGFTSRLKVRSDVTALDLLCGPEAVSRLKAAVEELNTRDRRSFLRGFRLAVATRTAVVWVDHAELLGLQHFDRLFNWPPHTRARRNVVVRTVSDRNSLA